jgi:membrane-associated protease RseP (regulator of RpoE activity)
VRSETKKERLKKKENAMVRRMSLVALVATVSLMGLASKSNAQSAAKSGSKVGPKVGPKVGLIPNPDQRWLRQVGLQVVLVFPGSPAAQQGMEAGDIIVGVNGLPVRSQADMTRALTQGGRVARLEVIDCNTGWPSEVTVYPIMGRIGVQTTPVPVSDYRPLPPFPPRPFPPFIGSGSQAGE